MRLKIATVFALLVFAYLGIVLVQISRTMPETVNRRPATQFDPDLVDGVAALAILESFLDISPRDSGTKGAKRAAALIAKQLLSTGLEPVIDEFDDVTPDGKVKFRNVTTTIPGNGKSCIVLLSHYDTKSGISRKFTGANDSGSSTALLLHMTAALKHGDTNLPDIVVAFVDGEECMEYYSSSDGLHGSKRLANRLAAQYGVSNIIAAVLLDMIGDSDLTLTIPRNSSPPLIHRLFEAADVEGKRNMFSLYSPMLDDHSPFLAKGIPAIDIIDFYYGSAPRLNDYWHTDDDTIDKLSAESLTIVGRTTIRLINSLITTPLEK
jgi:glutaminyl-peptide cyclotransferase